MLRPLLATTILSTSLLGMLVAVHSATTFQGDHQGTVAEWIRLLGSKRFEERERATQRLLESAEATTALRNATQSPDPEVARRARSILDERTRRQWNRSVERVKAFARSGAVDQFLDLLAPWPAGVEDARCWDAAHGLTERLTDLYLKKTAQALTIVFLKYAGKVPVKVVPLAQYKRTGNDGASFFARGTAIQTDRLQGDLFVCSGAVQAQRIHIAALFAGGPVEVQRQLTSSVVVCDGDITVRGLAGDCLIVARGKVTLQQPHEVGSCWIVSGKDIVMSKKTRPIQCVLSENDPRPLGFIRFFEVSQAGIEVEAAKGGVRVKAAAAGKPFARAGLAAGDVITAVNGAAAGDPESFRRLLRHHLVREEEITLRVLRGDKALTLRIPTEKRNGGG
jgi:hypothetical protein